MGKKLKLLSILLASIGGIIVVALSGLVWLVAPHSPDLTPERAAKIISATPDFNQSRSLVAVSETERGTDSTADSSYTAKFTFTSSDSTEPIAAEAEFRFWKSSWHLQEFHYGERSNVKSIFIRSDELPF